MFMNTHDCNADGIIILPHDDTNKGRTQQQKNQRILELSIEEKQFHAVHFCELLSTQVCVYSTPHSHGRKRC